MSLPDLSKLWTEPTKIGHIFRKYSTLKKFFGKIQPISDTENDLETQNFEIFTKVVHNFDKSDNVITQLS